MIIDWSKTALRPGRRVCAAFCRTPQIAWQVNVASFAFSHTLGQNLSFIQSSALIDQCGEKQESRVRVVAATSLVGVFWKQSIRKARLGATLAMIPVRELLKGVWK